MPTAHFRFHDTLNFFLPRATKDRLINHDYEGRVSVKDMIESLGVPHPEIEMIVINGRSVDFNTIVQHGASINVYSIEFVPQIPNPEPLRPPYPGRPTFILDQHLGRLAAYLRMMGFDTLYRNDYHDEELAQVSHDETRILLTRDIGLLKRSAVIYGYFVRETNRHKQLAEITNRYHLKEQVIPFSRCMKCNGLVESVSSEEVADQLPEGTALYYDVFHRCTACGQVYWKGAHHQRMQALLDDVLK
jgi:uncharacterized protein with PIN domain